MSLKIVVGSQLIITDPTPAIQAYCESNLVIRNPKYYQLQRMGKWVGNEPKEIYLYDIKTKPELITYILPFGCLNDIWSLVRDPDAFDLAYQENEPVEYEELLQLRDYQDPIPYAVADKKNGIVIAPCGSGKTVTGLMSIARLKKKALWITHTVDLLNQSRTASIEALGLHGNQIGTITAGKCRIGTHITFATVQTLSKMPALEQLADEFDMIVVDECHRCCVNAKSVGMFQKALSVFNCRYKIGLTATAHRSDGLIQGMFALLGPVIYEVPKEAVKENTVGVNISFRLTDYDYSDDVLDTDGTILFGKLVDDIALDQERNQQIADDLAVNAEHYNLILSDRIFHLHMLMDMLPERSAAALIDSKTPKAKREETLKDVKAGKYHYLFATYQLAKEGLDIPRLDRLYMALPKKDYAVVIQSVGRIARAFADKKNAVCYDYVDDIGICRKMYRERLKSYRKQGYQTNMIVLGGNKHVI